MLSYATYEFLSNMLYINIKITSNLASNKLTCLLEIHNQMYNSLFTLSHKNRQDMIFYALFIKHISMVTFNYPKPISRIKTFYCK